MTIHPRRGGNTFNGCSSISFLHHLSLFFCGGSLKDAFLDAVALAAVAYYGF